MKGRIVFLGTSSAIPTKDRNHSSIFFQYQNNLFLFDCGECTQRQLIKKGLSFYKIDNIFLSHLHGDHVLGIPGLLQTLDFHGKEKINIYGPSGTKELINNILKCFYIGETIKVNVKEISEGIIFNTSEFFIESAKLNHTVECFGFSFKEKDYLKLNKDKIKLFNLSNLEIKELLDKKRIKKGGKTIKIEDISYLKKGFKFTYIADTYYTENIFKLAKNSDILVIECTYFDQNEEAKEYKHLSFEIFKEKIYPKLKKLNVKKIYLTHFSRRFKDLTIFEEAIKKEKMNNVFLAHDFLEVHF
jgi:ribonuclease Z